MELQDKINSLECALEREKSARETAEALLEQRSSELCRISKELEQSNALTKELSNKKKSTHKLNHSKKLSEILLANLIAGAPVGILMINEFGKITLANKKFCDIFQLKVAPEELVGYQGSTVSEQCKSSVKDPQRFIEKVKQLHERKSVILKEEIEFADGRLIERNCMPLSYLDKYKGLLVSYYDITAATNFENKLKKQKEKYATAIENMNLGWTETDSDGYVTWANKRFCELSGYSLEELIGKDATELLLAEESRDYIEFYNDHDQKIYESHGIQIKTKSGKIKHLLVSGMRTHDSKGEEDGAIGIQFDNTKQKKLELQKEELVRKLESQNEQLNDYAHVVSHDLKLPLRGISALLAWTKEDFSKNLGEAGMENLKLIEESIEKMDMLIENVLKYSLLDNSQLKNVNIDLNIAVKEILAMLIVPKGIQVVIVNELPVICADITRIQQLFQNLIGNAVNHINKQKGKIEIDYIDTETHHQFSIKDNGMGIKKEYHDKIFKIYKSFNNRETSTGVGLSIVKKIIEQYEGEIWLESEVGVGTTFLFTLKKQS